MVNLSHAVPSHISAQFYVHKHKIILSQMQF